jgi:hypothetical protein
MMSRSVCGLVRTHSGQTDLWTESRYDKFEKM